METPEKTPTPKYFEYNPYEECDPYELHQALSSHAANMANLIYFHAVYDKDGNTVTGFQKTPYSLIAICEAIIKTMPDEKAKDGYESVKKDLYRRCSYKKRLGLK